MRTIKTNVLVQNAGRAIINLRLPSDIRQGRYRAVVVIEEQPEREQKARKPIRLPRYNTGLADEQGTFSRKELYGNDGR
jgi:hypothetical protein